MLLKWVLMSNHNIIKNTDYKASIKDLRQKILRYIYVIETRVNNDDLYRFNIDKITIFRLSQ